LKSGFLLQIDAYLIENILVVISAAVVAVLLVLYFRDVFNEFLRQGIMIGIPWLVINWALDMVIYLPLAQMDLPPYFTQGGIRYLTILIMTVTVGYLVEHKVNHILAVVNKKQDI
jgi:hypothetical protein